MNKQFHQSTKPGLPAVACSSCFDEGKEMTVFSTALARLSPFRAMRAGAVPYIVVALGIALYFVTDDISAWITEQLEIAAPMWSTRDGWENL